MFLIMLFYPTDWKKKNMLHNEGSIENYRILEPILHRKSVTKFYLEHIIIN